MTERGPDESAPGTGAPGADADERRLAALYGMGDPPPEEGGGRNPFWWVWVLVVPFALVAIGLLTWRLLTSPQRVLPGM